MREKERSKGQGGKDSERWNGQQGLKGEERRHKVGYPTKLKAKGY